MIYNKSDDGFEFVTPSSAYLGSIIVVGVLIFSGVIYCLMRVDPPLVFFIIAPLLLLLLALLLSIWPAINAAKKSEYILVWGANREGLIVPEKRSSFKDFLPPLVIPWESISRLSLVETLVDKSIRGETSLSNNILVVELESGQRQFFSYPDALRQELCGFLHSLDHHKSSVDMIEALEIY